MVSAILYYVKSALFQPRSLYAAFFLYLALFLGMNYRYATWYFAFVVVDFLFTRLIAGGAEVDDQIGGKPGAGAREPPGGHGSWRQRLRMRQHSRRAGREQHPTCACLAPHQAAH